MFGATTCDGFVTAPIVVAHRNAETIERPPTDCGRGSLLFVDRLQIGRVDELVVRDFSLRLHLLAETACFQNVSMALIPCVQAELA
jgi:hypothetical protein